MLEFNSDIFTCIDVGSLGMVSLKKQLGPPVSVTYVHSAEAAVYQVLTPSSFRWDKESKGVGAYSAHTYI